jgi:hypothetical protein
MTSQCELNLLYEGDELLNYMLEKGADKTIKDVVSLFKEHILFSLEFRKLFNNE